MSAALERQPRHPGAENVTADYRHTPRQTAVADNIEIGIERGGAGIKSETDARGAVKIIAAAEEIELGETSARQLACPLESDRRAQEAGLINSHRGAHAQAAQLLKNGRN